jgi:hypothetical protein
MLCPMMSRPIHRSEYSRIDMEYVECAGPNCGVWDCEVEQCGLIAKSPEKKKDDKPK